MNRAEIGRGFIWTAAFGLVTKLFVPIVTSILIPRFIGPAELGLYGILAIVFSFGEMMRDFGLGSCYISDRNLTPQRSQAYRGLSIVSALLLAVPIALLSPWLARVFYTPEIGAPAERLAAVTPGFLWIAGCIALGGFVTIPLADLTKNGRFRDAGIAEAVPSVVGAVVALIGVGMGLGFEALVALSVVKAVGTTIAVSLFTGLGRPQFISPEARSILRSAVQIFASMLAGMSYSLLGSLIAQRNLNIVGLGLYNQAFNLALRPSDLVLAPLSRTLFVAFSQRDVEGLAIRRAFGRAMKAGLLLSTPIYIFLGTFAHPLVLLLLGEKFLGSVPPLQAFCVLFGARSLGNIAGTALISVGRAGHTTWPWIVGYAVLGGVVLVKQDSIQLVEIAVTVTVGTLLVYGIMLGMALRRLPLPEGMAAQILLAVVVLLGFGGIAFAIQALVPGVYGALGVSVLALPFVHLALIGTFFAKSPTRYLSPQGLKRLWREI